MAALSFSLADVKLTSTWSCNGSGHSTPSTAQNTRTVQLGGAASGAAGVLTGSIPGSPLSGAALCTVNGTAVSARPGTFSVPVTIGGDGSVSIPFRFRANGESHNHVQSHAASISFTGMVLTVGYDDPGTASSWSIRSASVDAGGSISVTVTPGGSGYTHRLTAALGSYSRTVSMGSGVNSASLAIPLDWLRAFPDAPSAQAEVTLETFREGVSLGKSTKQVIVNAPASAIPSLSAECSRVLTVGGVTYPDVTGGYVQQKSAVRAEITDAQGVYGSTIVSRSINVGGMADAAFNSAGASLTSPLLPMAGSVPVTFRVTDSRGRSAQVVHTIEVTAYSPPGASFFTVQRVDEYGQPDDRGTRGRYSFTPVFTSLEGRNFCSAALTALGVTVQSPPESGWLMPGEVKTLDPLLTYEVILTLTDVYGSVTVSTSVSSINFAMHFSADGTSTWIGEACRHSNAFGVAENRDVYFYGSELRELIRGMIPPAISMLDAYPVGSVYISADSRSPAAIFGGAWEQLQERFLLAAGGVYGAGSEGGAAEVTLTLEQMPRHHHTLKYYTTGGGATLDWGCENVNKTVAYASGRIGDAGGGLPHGNMPPYLAVYMWKRTA